MKFLIIFVVIIGLVMLGFAVVMRKIKKFFSGFTAPMNNFNQSQSKIEEDVLYDDGKVKVYKGESKD